MSLLDPPRGDDTLRPRFREDGMSFRELAQDIVGPWLTDDDADWVLWEQTPFPLVRGVNDLRPYLERVRDDITVGGRGGAS